MDRYVGTGEVFHALLWNEAFPLAKAGYAIPEKEAGDCRVAINSGVLGDGESTLTVGGADDTALVGDPSAPVSVAAQNVSIATADTYPRFDVVTIDGTGTANVQQGTAAPAEISQESVSVPEEAGRLQVDKPDPDSLRGLSPAQTPVALLWVPGAKTSVTTNDLFDIRVEPFRAVGTSELAAVRRLLEHRPQGIPTAALANSAPNNYIESTVPVNSGQRLELWGWGASESVAAGGTTPVGLDLAVLDAAETSLYSASGVRWSEGDPTVSPTDSGALTSVSPPSDTVVSLRLTNNTGTDYSSSSVDGGVGATFAYRVVDL